MKLLLLCVMLASCSGAPQMFQYPAISSAGPVIAYTQSLSPAVMKIPEPGIRMSVPRPVQSVAPVQYAVPAPAPVVAAPTPYVAPVQMATPVVAAPAPVVAAPTPYVATPVVVAQAPEPLMAPEAPMPSVGVPHVGGQFHAQDEAGQYAFGHWGGPNTRVETRDYLGRTSGSFAYVNPDGDVQVRKYAAAPTMGFKVAASDLPVDEPAVAQVKSAHAQAHMDAKNKAANPGVSTA